MSSEFLFYTAFSVVVFCLSSPSQVTHILSSMCMNFCATLQLKLHLTAVMETLLKIFHLYFSSMDHRTVNFDIKMFQGWFITIILLFGRNEIDSDFSNMFYSQSHRRICCAVINLRWHAKRIAGLMLDEQTLIKYTL